MGAKGWSYRDVLPFFKMSEGCQCINFVDKDLHGENGPLAVSRRSPLNPIACAFVKSCTQAGFVTGDYNGSSMFRVAHSQFTTLRGARFSAADAFLTPSKGRHNLKVVTQAQVIRILFAAEKPLRAVGVEYINQHGELVCAFASKEVVVCAGAINSPKLLLLSGIGPRDDLDRLHIPFVKVYEHKCNLMSSCNDFVLNILQELPVGRDLQDHLWAYLHVRGPAGVAIGAANFAKNTFLERLRWQLTGSGMLASSGNDAQLFCSSGKIQNTHHISTLQSL